MSEKILTAAEAVAITPEIITDKAVVEAVQQTLLEKGYVDGGPADGDPGEVTKDELLAFRRRNDLPLVPVIDQQFIDALATASSKEIPARVALASTEHVAERVEAVKINEAVARVSWWSKFVTFWAAVPGAALSLLIAIIDNFDEAAAAIAPVKNLFFDISFLWYAIGFALIVTVFGYQQWRIGKLSGQIQTALVDGYRQGTVKNDVPGVTSNAG